MIRFTPFLILVVTLSCSTLLFWLLLQSAIFGWVCVTLIPIFALGIVDFTQRKSTILGNYPLIDRLHFLLQKTSLQASAKLVGASGLHTPDELIRRYVLHRDSSV